MKLHQRLNRPRAKARTNKKGTEKCTASRGTHQHQRQDKSRYNSEVKAERYTSTAANQINNSVSQTLSTNRRPTQRSTIDPETD